MPATEIAKRPDRVLNDENVASAIAGTAGDDEALQGALQERAVEATRTALRLAKEAERELSDEALIDIAASAVTSSDPSEAALNTFHHLVSWLGPDNVPNHLRFSWEPEKMGGKKVRRKGGALFVGDAPKVWTEGLKPPPAEPELTEEVANRLEEQRNQAALIDQAVMDSADVAKALGRIEAANFFSRVGDLVVAQAFIDLRNSKKYKNYPYRDGEGKVRTCENLEEFCAAHLGKSYKRCFTLAQNLNLLGSDLYEAAERIGFRARDYTALKALPPGEREVVKQALASESKEQVLDLLQDLAERHAREREDATKAAEDLTADLAARDKLLKDRTDKVETLRVELEKLKSLPPNRQARLRLDREEQAIEKLQLSRTKALAAVAEFLREVADIVAAEVSVYTKEHAAWMARWLCEEINEHLLGLGVEVDFQGIVQPEWTREMAKTSPVADAAPNADGEGEPEDRP